MNAPLCETPPQSRVSPSSPVTVPRQATLATTPIWSIWELWCDFPEQEKTKSKSDIVTETITKKSWLDTIKSFGVVDTVEGFWGIHNCVLPPSQLPLPMQLSSASGNRTSTTNYYFFRHNIAPLWEHEGNRRGGKWVVAIDGKEETSERVVGERADKIWTNVSVALIGEQFDGKETEICGVTATRKGLCYYRIALWTRTANDKDQQLLIGKYLKGIIQNVYDEEKGGNAVPIIHYVPHCKPLDIKNAPAVLYSL